MNNIFNIELSTVLCYKQWLMYLAKTTTAVSVLNSTLL